MQALSGQRYTHFQESVMLSMHGHINTMAVHHIGGDHETCLSCIASTVSSRNKHPEGKESGILDQDDVQAC